LPKNSEPFTIEEERIILNQLYELRRAREEINGLREYIKRDQEVDERERSIFQRAIELEKEATRLAKLEKDLLNDKANLYENLYKSITSKPSIGCKIARVITIGIYRCR
jgi:hypothetical protein